VSDAARAEPGGEFHSVLIGGGAGRDHGVGDLICSLSSQLQKCVSVTLDKA